MVRVNGCLYSVGGNNAIDPAVGVSLLRNCTIGVGVPAIEGSGPLPYAMHVSPGGLQLSLLSGAGAASVQVLDATGRSIAQQDLLHGDLELSQHGLASGAYAVSIAIDGRRYAERWLVTKAD
jgi:hypothetical protein